VTIVMAWLAGLNESYRSLVFNKLGFDHSIGIQDFLEAAGVGTPSLLAVGILLSIMLWMFRARIKDSDVFGILIALTFSFVGHLHDYDYVGVVCIVAALWGYSRQKVASLVVSVPLVLLLFAPQRLVRSVQFPALNHWRELVVVLLVLFLFVLSLRDRQRTPRLPAIGVDRLPDDVRGIVAGAVFADGDMRTRDPRQFLCDRTKTSDDERGDPKIDDDDKQFHVGCPVCRPMTE
jgi:hypothetical protein